MNLYDVTGAKDRGIDPQDLADSDYIRQMQAKLHPATFKKIVRRADAMLDRMVAASFGKLAWTKTGVLFGHKSQEPKKHVDETWDELIEVFGEDKTLLKAVGTLLMWRISVRTEPSWLLYRQDSGNVDPDTGKTIYVCTYWIDASYQPPVRAGVRSLAGKWGAKLNQRNHA